MADITERKRVEQAIFEEKERAQVTLQSIGDARHRDRSRGPHRVSESRGRAADGLAGGGGARRIRSWTCCGCVDEIDACRNREPAAALPARGPRGAASARTACSSIAWARRSRSRIRRRRSAIAAAAPSAPSSCSATSPRNAGCKHALSYQASHDALTGLINRREFDAPDRCRRCAARARALCAMRCCTSTWISSRS